MTPRFETERDCPRAWEAMPWVLQGSAPDEDVRWLAEHVAGCAACRDEYAQQQRLRAALALPAQPALDPEQGLRRLLARLDEPATEPAPGPAPREAQGWLVRALVAAVLLQAIGLGAFALKTRSASHADTYRTYSDAPASTPPGAIHVVPDTTMKVADWNALLRTQQLRVVGGPNDVGAYTVVPGDGVAAQAAIARLRATRGIRFAEPVAGPP